MYTAQEVMFIKGIDPRALTGNSFTSITDICHGNKNTGNEIE